jgi:hypothetical protein
MTREHRKQYLVWDDTVQEWTVCSWNEVRGKFEPPACNLELPGDAPYRELPEPPEKVEANYTFVNALRPLNVPKTLADYVMGDRK